jgi:hypothetical protein
MRRGWAWQESTTFLFINPRRPLGNTIYHYKLSHELSSNVMKHGCVPKSPTIPEALIDGKHPRSFLMILSWPMFDCRRVTRMDF